MKGGLTIFLLIASIFMSTYAVTREKIFGASTPVAFPYTVTTSTAGVVGNSATTTRFGGSILPQVNKLYDMGDSVNSWRNAYVSGTVFGASGNFTNISWINATGTNTTSTNLYVQHFVDLGGNGDVTAKGSIGVTWYPNDPATSSGAYLSIYNATQTDGLLFANELNKSVHYNIDSLGDQGFPGFSFWYFAGPKKDPNDLSTFGDLGSGFFMDAPNADGPFGTNPTSTAQDGGTFTINTGAPSSLHGGAPGNFILNFANPVDRGNGSSINGGDFIYNTTRSPIGTTGRFSAIWPYYDGSLDAGLVGIDNSTFNSGAFVVRRFRDGWFSRNLYSSGTISGVNELITSVTGTYAFLTNLGVTSGTFNGLTSTNATTTNATTTNLNVSNLLTQSFCNNTHTVSNIQTCNTMSGYLFWTGGTASGTIMDTLYNPDRCSVSWSYMGNFTLGGAGNPYAYVATGTGSFAITSPAATPSGTPVISWQLNCGQ